MAVFVVSGLWHGANWTFVVWGGAQRRSTSSSRICGGGGSEPRPAPRAGARAIVQAVVTFHLILVSWVFFRARAADDALTILSRVAASAGRLPPLLATRLAAPEILASLILIVLLMAVEAAFDETRSMWARLAARPTPVRWVAYYALALALVVLGVLEPAAVRLHAVLTMGQSLTVDAAPQASGSPFLAAPRSASCSSASSSTSASMWRPERLIDPYAVRNRFFAVHAAPPARYDFVVLGASHAAVFDYRDMTRQLEGMSAAKIMNLSVVGGGVVPNALLFDYFLYAGTRPRTCSTSSIRSRSTRRSGTRSGWQDRRLFVRAPFDPSLAGLLLRSGAPLSAVADYVSGFSKINNPDRFGADRPAEAARFDRRYRAVDQIDRQRGG